MTRFQHLLSLFLIIMLLAITACKDDDDSVSPSTFPSPTMANIWPHADGTTWTYEGTYSEYPNPETPTAKQYLETELPTMEELYTALQQPIAGTPSLAVDGMYRLALEGIVTTDTGVEAQAVSQTLYLSSPTKSDIPSVSVTENSDQLLRMIAQSRPDLRATICAQQGWTDKDWTNIRPPMFLGGYAFAYEDSGYYGYGDLDSNHSWLYLEKSLAAGSEFTMQLVPVLADDIWLHGRIWSRGTLKVGGRTYRNVIECMYVVDLGEAVATDENGTAIGTVRDYFYGTTHFAPQVGPIRGRERQVRSGMDIMMDESAVIRDYVMDLVETTSTN